MHTYPAWKIWLVAIVMLVATLLARRSPRVVTALSLAVKLALLVV